MACCRDSLDIATHLTAWLDTLTATPSHPVAHYGAGLAYLALGRDSLALEHLRRTIITDGSDPLCYAHLAESARRAQRLPVIAAELEEKIAANSSTISPLGLGMVLIELAAWDSAEACGRAALAPGSNAGEAHLLLARALRGMGHYADAVDHGHQAISLAERSGDNELLVRSLDALCITHRTRGDLSRAAQVGNQALSLSSTYDLRHLEAPIRSELGYLYLFRGDHGSAEAMLRKALAAAERTGDSRSRGWALKLLGNALAGLGDLDAAERLLREALEALRAVRDPEGPAACLDALAGLAARRGQVRDAETLYDHALALHRARHDHRAESATLINLGSTWLEYGEVAKAVARLQEAMQVATAGEDSANMWASHIGLGNAYLALGDLDRGGDFLHQAHILAQVRRDTTMIATTEGTLGSLEYRRGALAQARDHFLMALRLFERLGDRRSMASALMNAGMSMVHEDMRGAERAIRGARDIAAEYHDPYGRASVGAALGELALRGGRYDEAESLLTDCLTQASMLGAPDIMWFAQYGLARCHEAAQEWDASLCMYEAAIATVEDCRGRLPVHEWRFGFLATTLEIHERFISFLAARHERHPTQGFARRAFEIAEAVKARSFLDLLDESEKRRLGVGGSWVDTRASLVWEISRLSKTLWQLPDDSPYSDTLRREVAAREDELNRAHLPSDPSGFATTAALYEPLDMLQVQMGAAGITLLLEYFTGNNGSFLWAIRSDTLMMQALPSRGRLTELVTPFIDAASHPPRIGVDDEIWRHRLAEVLLPPSQWWEDAGGRICVVPDGPLFYVPFEALPAAADSSGWAFLIETASVSYAPSTAVLLTLWERADSFEPEGLLAVGIREPRGIEPGAGLERLDGAQAIDSGKNRRSRVLPPLCYAEFEAESVCASFERGLCTTLVGAEASETRVMHELQQPYTIAHLATHSLIDPRLPRRSCIVLNPEPGSRDDGVLVFDEILGLASSPELVVLSSCETAMGQLISGEGIVGLSRAFFHAGARAVLVSLWPVNDRSTAIWMRDFYGRLASGTPADQALRETRLSFLLGDIPALRHPYYWAPFVLIGGL
jgi:tetratricopeptide (TPR) repeat protein